MSVYNGERYLRESIESILRQTLEAFEFIIINDGSTDASSDIIGEYNDSRIIHLNNASNRGLAYSLNRGLKVARGEFIARQDADDISSPDRLTRQVSFLRQNKEIGLVGTGSKWIDDQCEMFREWNPPTDQKEIQQKILRALPILHASIMFWRSCMQQINCYYDETYPVAQDTDFLFRFSEAWDVSNVSEPLYVYRQHSRTTTSKRGEEQQRYLKKAQDSAIGRRISFGLGRLGLSRSGVPAWVRDAKRRWLAERFAWWSACTRSHSKDAALSMLLIAVFLDPTTPDIRTYLKGIAARKTGIRSRAPDQSWFS